MQFESLLIVFWKPKLKVQMANVGALYVWMRSLMLRHENISSSLNKIMYEC